MVEKDTEEMLAKARSKMILGFGVDREKKEETQRAKFNPVIEEMLFKARSSFIVSFILEKLSQAPQDPTEING